MSDFQNLKDEFEWLAALRDETRMIETPAAPAKRPSSRKISFRKALDEVSHQVERLQKSIPAGPRNLTVAEARVRLADIERQGNEAVAAGQLSAPEGALFDVKFNTMLAAINARAARGER